MKRRHPARDYSRVDSLLEDAVPTLKRALHNAVLLGREEQAAEEFAEWLDATYGEYVGTKTLNEVLAISYRRCGLRRFVGVFRL